MEGEERPFAVFFESCKETLKPEPIEKGLSQ